MADNGEQKQDIRVGDRVRVTYEGTIERVYSDGDLVLARDFYIAPKPTTTQVEWSVELLERALPKVGDVLKGSGLESLPIASMVWSEDFDEHRVKDRQGWYNPANGSHPRPGLSCHYRVLYIPSGE